MEPGRLTARFATLALLALALASGLGGCGSGSDSSSASVAASADPTYVSPLRLRVDLGNAFSAGLYRLAVMSQPADGATDLGQSLPTGFLDGVTCSPPPAGTDSSRTEIAHCSVRWRTQGGNPRRTNYRIRMYDDGCFDASARPSLPPHIDPTIEGYSEHPLNVLVGAESGCS